MITTAIKIVLGLIVATAVCIAFVVALCADLVATETKPRPRRVRLDRAHPALRSMMEARS